MFDFNIFLNYVAAVEMRVSLIRQRFKGTVKNRTSLLIIEMTYTVLFINSGASTEMFSTQQGITPNNWIMKTLQIILKYKKQELFLNILIYLIAAH